MVIQRWQSVLLLIAAVVMGLFSFLSLGQAQTVTQTINFTAQGFVVEGQPTGGAVAGSVMHTIPFFIMSLMCALLPLVNIFLYRNLRLQKRMCMIELLFLLTVVGLGVYYCYYNPLGYIVNVSSMAFAPFVAFLAVLGAVNRISSDYHKLRSIDRIR